MVTRGTYYDEDEQSFRRYSSRGHGYPLSHGRELPPTPHHGPYARQHMPSHTGQSNRQSPEQDTNAQPRRRIPVACGRCRKRKIRCSGDPGNGQPCSNCKSAGNDTCQFLRVSSTEAQMKNEPEFGYDSASAVSRIHCRMSPYGPQHQPYTPHVTSLGPDGFPPYRHNSLSAYQIPVKYYGIPSYGDFAEENTDYGMHASNYSIMTQEPISIPYTSAGSTRWSQPQITKSNSLFVEQDSSYNHGQLPFHTPAYQIRPATSPESKSMSLNGMSTALPVPVNGTDRVLPAPASYRPAQMGNFVRSSDILPMSQPPMHYTNNALMNTSMMNAVKALNASATSDNSSLPSNYLPLSSSPDSVPSSGMSFGTQSVSSTQQTHEAYTPSHEAAQHSLFQHCNNSSDLDIYGPSSASSHRPSVSSQANGEDSQSLSNNSGSGSLVNGSSHYYIPPTATQTSYPAPPMVNMEPVAPVIPRQPVSAS